MGGIDGGEKGYRNIELFVHQFWRHTANMPVTHGQTCVASERWHKCCLYGGPEILYIY